MGWVMEENGLGTQSLVHAFEESGFDFKLDACEENNV